MTVNAAEPVLECVSVDVHVTVVTPMANVEPDAREHATVPAASSGSLAETVNVTTAPDGLVALAVMGPGTVTTGGVTSRTVTVNDADPVLPCVSVDVHVTVVVAYENTEPDAGEHDTGPAASSGSVAVAANVTVAPAALVPLTVMFEGTVTTGDVVSTGGGGGGVASGGIQANLVGSGIPLANVPRNDPVVRS